MMRCIILLNRTTLLHDWWTGKLPRGITLHLPPTWQLPFLSLKKCYNRLSSSVLTYWRQKRYSPGVLSVNLGLLHWVSAQGPRVGPSAFTTSFPPFSWASLCPSRPYSTPSVSSSMPVVSPLTPPGLPCSCFLTCPQLTFSNRFVTTFSRRPGSSLLGTPGVPRQPLLQPFLVTFPSARHWWGAVGLEGRDFMFMAVGVKMECTNSHKQQPLPSKSLSGMPHAREPACFLHVNLCILGPT